MEYPEPIDYCEWSEQAKYYFGHLRHTIFTLISFQLYRARCFEHQVEWQRLAYTLYENEPHRMPYRREVFNLIEQARRDFRQPVRECVLDHLFGPKWRTSDPEPALLPIFDPVFDCCSEPKY